MVFFLFSVLWPLPLKDKCLILGVSSRSYRHWDHSATTKTCCVRLVPGAVRIVSEVDSTVVPSSLVKAASARLSRKPWIPQGTRIKQTLDEASFPKASRIRILCAKKVAETF